MLRILQLFGAGERLPRGRMLRKSGFSAPENPEMLQMGRVLQHPQPGERPLRPVSEHPDQSRRGTMSSSCLSLTMLFSG